jgi:hypothetical protein
LKEFQIQAPFIVFFPDFFDIHEPFWVVKNGFYMRREHKKVMFADHVHFFVQ